MMAKEGFWDRLAARTVPSGALVAMENPRTIVRMALVWTLGSIPGVGVLATLFFWFGEPAAGWAQVGMALFYAVAWVFFVATGSTRGTFILLAGVSVVGVAVVHVSMGGFANSGAVLMWGIPMTTVAVLLLKRWEALVVGVSVAALAVVFGFLEQTLQASRSSPDPTLPAVLFPTSVVMVIILVVPVIGLLVSRLSFERERAESLLLNVLPAEVASELKETEAPLGHAGIHQSPCYSPTSLGSPRCPLRWNPMRWSISSTKYSASSTRWPCNTAARRSGQSATPTWLPREFPPQEKTMPRRLPPWLWTCSPTPKRRRSVSDSGSTRGP